MYGGKIVEEKNIGYSNQHTNKHIRMLKMFTIILAVYLAVTIITGIIAVGFSVKWADSLSKYVSLVGSALVIGFIIASVRNYLASSKESERRQEELRRDLEKFEEENKQRFLDLGLPFKDPEDLDEWFDHKKSRRIVVSVNSIAILVNVIILIKDIYEIWFK